jgi:arsenate reductase
MENVEMAKPRHVLFLCTGNCCRSQMAEALLRHVGGERFVAHSAGSDPTGYVHPLAIAALEQLGVPLPDDARSKSWDEFADQPMDVVVTLCDHASELCPAWWGDSLRSHWPTPDPSFHPGSEEERIAFAVRVAERLRLKIERFISLDFDGTDPDELFLQLDFIGQM